MVGLEVFLHSLFSLFCQKDLEPSGNYFGNEHIHTYTHTRDSWKYLEGNHKHSFCFTSILLNCLFIFCHHNNWHPILAVVIVPNGCIVYAPRKAKGTRVLQRQTNTGYASECHTCLLICYPLVYMHNHSFIQQILPEHSL